MRPQLQESETRFTEAQLDSEAESLLDRLSKEQITVLTSTLCVDTYIVHACLALIGASF